MIGLLGNIDSIHAYNADDYTLTLFNTLPYEREEVIELVLDTPRIKKAAADIGVGGASQLEDCYDIIDSDGNKLEYVELSCDNISIGVERELDTKAIKFDAKRRHILVKAKLPQNGYVTYAVRMREPEYAYHQRKRLGRSQPHHKVARSQRQRRRLFPVPTHAKLRGRIRQQKRFCRYDERLARIRGKSP